jgi:hypothetical protein
MEHVKFAPPVCAMVHRVAVGGPARQEDAADPTTSRRRHKCSTLRALPGTCSAFDSAHSAVRFAVRLGSTTGSTTASTTGSTFSDTIGIAICSASGSTHAAHVQL